MARLQEAVGSVSFSPFGAPPAGYALDFPLVDATTAKGLTQEIRVAGDGERTDWVLGSFYSTSERQYGQSAYAEHYVAVNGAAVTDFLRLVTGVPDLVWSGSRALAGHPDTEELFWRSQLLTASSALTETVALCAAISAKSWETA